MSRASEHRALFSFLRRTNDENSVTCPYRAGNQLCCADLSQQKDTVDPDVAQQIRALAKKYDEAFSKNDAAALAGLFTVDAVQVAPEGVFYGRQAIEKKYRDIVFQQYHCNNYVQQIGQVIAVGNEAVWVGEWSASCGGNQAHGYISNVAVRECDAWKVRISTFNVTPPPPPAETK